MGQDHQGHVVVPAAPEAPLVVVQAVLAGRKPDRIIHAGGGKLVNIVVR